MEMTEQGKAITEVTFTITESTPSGNSYLKYWREKGPVTPRRPHVAPRAPTLPAPAPAHLRLGGRGVEAEALVRPAESTGKVRGGPGSPRRAARGPGRGAPLTAAQSSPRG